VLQKSVCSVFYDPHAFLFKFLVRPVTISCVKTCRKWNGCQVIESQIIESLQCRRWPFGPSGLHQTLSHPGSIPLISFIYPAYPINLHIPELYGQFSTANQPIPHIFGVWEETGAPGGNPRRHGGECANSTQTVTRAGNRTRDPGAVKQQC